MKMRIKNEVSFLNDEESRRTADLITQKMRLEGGRVKRVEDEYSITLYCTIEKETQEAPRTWRPLSVYTVGL